MLTNHVITPTHPPCTIGHLHFFSQEPVEGRRLLHILWDLFDRHTLWTRPEQAASLLTAMANEVLQQGQPQALLFTASLASRAGKPGTCEGGRGVALGALQHLVHGFDHSFLNPAAVVVMRCVWWCVIMWWCVIRQCMVMWQPVVVAAVHRPLVLPHACVHRLLVLPHACVHRPLVLPHACVRHILPTERRPGRFPLMHRTTKAAHFSRPPRN